MTVPANLTARHYAEQAVLAAIITEREAMAAFKAAPTGRDVPELRAWRTAHDAVNDAADTYYAAVQAVNRTADPVVENIAEAGTFEVHDCPGGAYVITTNAYLDPDAAADEMRALRGYPAEFDRADRYDSGYIASPVRADGRAADEFYGKDA